MRRLQATKRRRSDGVETTYLQEYVSIADCGSFTAAARDLHLTQSTLSKHVALLEREFGADLFVRDRNGVSLTDAGKVLYAQAVQVEKLLHNAKSLVALAREGRRHETVVRDIVDAGGVALERDTRLRCKCRFVAERCGLDQRELGALILYVEERGFDAIRVELGLTRDEVADVLGGVYRKLGVSDKQEALNFIHSVSE